MSDSERPTDKRKDASNRQSIQVVLTEAEIEVLLKAVKRYRQKIPSYIKSSEVELHHIDEIIKKLS
jgi:hypothetical protein